MSLGETPLITHCFLDDVAAATRLLLARANPNAVTQEGKVCLVLFCLVVFCFVFSCFVVFCRVLFCLGSSPPPPFSAHMQMRQLGSHAHKRRQEHAGMTALLYAAQEGHADIAKLLLDFKAYPDILHPTVPQAACLCLALMCLARVCLALLVVACISVYEKKMYLRDMYIYTHRYRCIVPTSGSLSVAKDICVS